MPTDPTGKVVREAIELRRYENGLARNVAIEFRKAADQLKILMAKYDVTERRSDLRKLLSSANELFDKLYRNVDRYTSKQLLDLAKLESDFARGVLNTAVGAAVDIKGKRIGKALAKSIIETDPIQGEVMKKWWSGQKKGTADAFRQQVQLGMTEHESIDQLVRRVRGRSIGGGRFTGGIMDTSTRKATALVRTAVNEVATKAKIATFEANDDITQEYELVVTFDSRTSDICIALDGKTYRYDDPARRMPPFHFNCRTTIAPVLDWSAAGLEPPEEGTKAVRDTETGKTTFVKSSTRYEDWLKNQPLAVQNEILGTGRAQLWRDGKIRLDQLVRQDGSTVTLGEFRKRLGMAEGVAGRPKVNFAPVIPSAHRLRYNAAVNDVAGKVPAQYRPDIVEIGDDVTPDVGEFKYYDKKGHVLLNTKHTAAMSDDELRSVIAHEIGHGVERSQVRGVDSDTFRRIGLARSRAAETWWDTVPVVEKPSIVYPDKIYRTIDYERLHPKLHYPADAWFRGTAGSAVRELYATVVDMVINGDVLPTSLRDFVRLLPDELQRKAKF